MIMKDNSISIKSLILDNISEKRIYIKDKAVFGHFFLFHMPSELFIMNHVGLDAF